MALTINPAIVPHIIRDGPAPSSWGGGLRLPRMPSPEASTTSSLAAENLHHLASADPKNICISSKQAPNTLVSTATTAINAVVVVTTTATFNSSTEGAARFTPVATTGAASSYFAGTSLHSQPPTPRTPANSTPSPPSTQGKVSLTNSRAGEQAHDVVRNVGREAHVGTNNSNHDSSSINSSLPATRPGRHSTKEEDKKVAGPTFPDRGRETGHYYDVSGLGKARYSHRNDTELKLGASWSVPPQTTPSGGGNSGKSPPSAKGVGGTMSSKRRSVKFCLELKVYLIPRAKEYNESEVRSVWWSREELAAMREREQARLSALGKEVVSRRRLPRIQYRMVRRCPCGSCRHA